MSIYQEDNKIASCETQKSSSCLNGTDVPSEIKATIIHSIKQNDLLPVFASETKQRRDN